MMKLEFFKTKLLSFCFALCVTFSISGQGLAQDFIPPLPSDFEATRISLMTVGLGTSLYSRYGHTMLRIQDPSNNLDYMVNWGIFDFSWTIPL